MPDSQPVVLIVTTQTWSQITSLAMRLAAYGCSIAALAPAECQVSYLPGLRGHFLFHPLHPVHSLRRAIQSSGAQYLLPADDLSVWLLHELAASDPELAPLVEQSLGDSKHFSTVRSRFSLLSLAQKLGIAIPPTVQVESANHLETLLAREDGPLVVKKDGTWGGNGVQFVRGAGEGRRAWSSLQRGERLPEKVMRSLRCGDVSAFIQLKETPAPEITAQSYIDGPPANSMIACHRGRVLGEVQARVMVSRGQTGPSLVIELIRDPRITAAGEALVRTLGLSGFVGFDFLLDERSQTPLLLEMNPRFTKLGHVQRAGAPDLAGLLWAQWTGAPNPAVGAADLSPRVYFHLEQTKDLAATELVHASRCDLSPAERAAFAALPKDNPAALSRLRRMVWRRISRLNKLRHVTSTPQPFFFEGDSHSVVSLGEENVSIAG